MSYKNMVIGFSYYRTANAAILALEERTTKRQGLLKRESLRQRSLRIILGRFDGSMF
jgi:hypothetical protein